MKIYNLYDYEFGKTKKSDLRKFWLVGNFDKSVLKTDKFELGVCYLNKGFIEKPHYHRLSSEINILLSGHMIVNGTSLHSGAIFVFAPSDVSNAYVVEDSLVVVARDGSYPGDKKEITPEELFRIKQ